MINPDLQDRITREAEARVLTLYMGYTTTIDGMEFLIECLCDELEDATMASIFDGAGIPSDADNGYDIAACIALTTADYAQLSLGERVLFDTLDECADHLACGGSPRRAKKRNAQLERFNLALQHVLKA